MNHLAYQRRNETLVGVGILLLLAGIAGGVFFRQFHFNPALAVPAVLPAASSAAATSPAAGDLAAARPDSLTTLGAAETFGPDTLSDKIDGRAELYLAAGFVGLQCQRFALAADPAAWLEVFVYDMGASRQAFAVYSTQRRAEAEPLDLTALAYQTRNALFFAQGRYYVELIGAVATAPLMEAMRAFGGRFIARTSGAAQPLRELALFPTAQLQPGSLKLLTADGFGFDRFDNVFLGTYRLGTNEVTAFLSRRSTPAEAAGLAAAYHAFLLANGGRDAGLPPGIPAAHLVTIMGTYELVFARGNVLAGVHAADDQAAAEQLAAALSARLTKVAP